MRTRGVTVLILGLATAMAAPAAAGPLTFNTALPVSQGEGILRGDAFVLRGSSGGLMDEDVTGLAFPADPRAYRGWSPPLAIPTIKRAPPREARLE